MSDLNRGHSIDASYQVSVYLANRFQRRRFFRNQPIRNNNCLWRPCLLTDQNKISNIYRGPFIDASYHFSIHLAKRFQRRRTLGIDQSEIRISCDGHIVNGSRQDEQSIQRTFHRCFLPSFGSFGKVMSEEKIFQKSTNQKQELPVAGMSVYGSGRNNQSLQRTFHRCFLPRFSLFG